MACTCVRYGVYTCTCTCALALQSYLSTGHFAAWGESEKGGSIPAAVKEQLEKEGVDQVCASEYVFFCKADRNAPPLTLVVHRWIPRAPKS